MNRGLVNLNELRKQVNQADFEGKSAFCFIKRDKIIKIYARKEDKGFFIPLNPSKICDFSKYSADTIVFPDEYIYENGKKAGEILNYINSKTLYDGAFTDQDKIDLIIKSYEKVTHDLELFDNISMIDLNFVNILYSNINGFHIIDTTDWLYADNSFQTNLYNFNESLVRSIIKYNELTVDLIVGFLNEIDDVFYHNLARYGNAGKDLQKNFDLIKINKYNFLNLIFSYCELYRQYYGINMKTLKDMKEITKVLKKG